MNRGLVYLGVAAITVGACGGNGKTVRPAVEELTQDTVTTDSVPEDASKEDDCGCGGDSLTEYGGKTYMVDYWGEDEDFKALSNTFIVGCQGGERVDTCRVDGSSVTLHADGKILKAIIGVDTVRYDITRLSKRIEPIKELATKDCRKQVVDHKFPIGLFSDTAYCQYRFYGYLPANPPLWLRQYLASALYSEQQSWMTEGVEIESLKEYQRLKENPKRYKGLDTSKASIDEIARYFACRFERLYKIQFKEGHEEWGTPLYENAIEVTPAWNSEDGRLATYRFYYSEYGGGVHGMMYEHYLTFDTATGRVLGLLDLYSDKEIEKTMIVLGQEIGIRRFGNPDQGLTADIGDLSSWIESHNNYYEEYKGKSYPRPALLGERVVFSYQPYDKGSFAEGILHFTMPYTGKKRSNK